MTPFWGHEERVANWVKARIPDCGDFGACRTLGVLDRTGRMAGAVVYHNWSPEAETIELSGAAENPRWLTRQVLKAMFSYPFDGIGCQMVVTRNSAHNKNAAGRGLHRLLIAIGFHLVRIPRLYGRNEDGMLFTLTDEAWRASPYSKERN